MMTIILVLALAAGGVAYHRVSVQRKAAAAELAARKEAEAKAARARKAAELEAARKKAEEQARAEAEEKARLEAERLAAEEAAGKRQKKEPEMVEPAPEAPKEEPVVQEEDPRLEIFKKPVLTPPTGSCLRMPSIWLSKRAVMICTPISCAPIWNGMP